jgi:hypothetical protein
MSSSPPEVSTKKANARLCAWCTCSADAPLHKHDASCDRRIMASIIDRGQNNCLSQNTVPVLENKIKNLIVQLSEYESTLRLIAAPKRPDGTFNRSREACRAIADNILKAYNASV